MAQKAVSRRTHESGEDRATFSRPFITVDVVIFTVQLDALQVLLVQRAAGRGEPFAGSWALPGGYVNPDLDATLYACAERKLLEKTGVISPYLEQLGSWGSRSRDPRGWSATHVYFALIPTRDIQLTGGGNTAAIAWFEVSKLADLPALAFDHSEIVAAALDRLRAKVEYTSLPAFLLSQPFTLPQLQKTYEVILGRGVDKSGFRTRMLAADFLEEAEMVDGDSNRPAMGYRLIHEKEPVIFPRTFSPREP